MATPVFIHNENLHIHTGKGAVDLKSGLPKTKSAKPGLKERKALRDLSNARLQAPGPSKAASGLKEKLKEKSGASKVKKGVRSGLSEEQIEKCREWAKEGIEYAEFTGNDALRVEQEQQAERVRKEVEMVMSAMRDWTASAYDFRMPKIVEDTEDIMKLELELEVLPPRINFGSNSDKEDIDDLLEADLDLLSFSDIPFEFKLKEEYD